MPNRKMPSSPLSRALKSTYSSKTHRRRKETARVQKEQGKTPEGNQPASNKKLSNQGFLSKAPAAVVEKEKGKLADYQEKMAALTKRMEDLAKL